MACLRGLDSDFCRFQVADFANHDDVRVLTEEGAQCTGESESHLRVHVYLIHTLQDDFRRVFRGGDIGIFGIQDVEAGVQRHRLAGTRRAGDENHALRLGKILQIDFALRCLITQRVDA